MARPGGDRAGSRGTLEVRGPDHCGQGIRRVRAMLTNWVAKSKKRAVLFRWKSSACPVFLLPVTTTGRREREKAREVALYRQGKFRSQVARQQKKVEDMFR